jgi:HSP20 family molecular chaperone IbpA
VDPESVEVKYNDGFLEIVLPKVRRKATRHMRIMTQ